MELNFQRNLHFATLALKSAGEGEVRVENKEIQSDLSCERSFWKAEMLISTRHSPGNCLKDPLCGGFNILYNPSFGESYKKAIVLKLTSPSGKDWIFQKNPLFKGFDIHLSV